MELFIIAGGKKKAPMFALSNHQPLICDAQELQGPMQCFHLRTFVTDELREGQGLGQGLGLTRNMSVLQRQPAVASNGKGNHAYVIATLS